VEELFTPAEELALGAFLAGYSGLTREAYALDLRQWASWCTERSIALFGVRRLTSNGSAATHSVARRLGPRLPRAPIALMER
jgi:hypothetical protein